MQNIFVDEELAWKAEAFNEICIWLMPHAKMRNIFKSPRNALMAIISVSY